MAQEKTKFKYYPEETLIDLVQRGVFSWVDYVLHYSEEWREEFTTFLAERGMEMNNQCPRVHSFQGGHSRRGYGAGISMTKPND